jgi:hypothetical protein
MDKNELIKVAFESIKTIMLTTDYSKTGLDYKEFEAFVIYLRQIAEY